MPRGGGTPNGGVIGKTNRTSFGKCTVTSKTSSAPSAVTTQAGTRLVNTVVVAGGGGGGGYHGVQIFSKVEAGNKLLTIIILENNTQVLDTFTIQQKINFYYHNLINLGR